MSSPPAGPVRSNVELIATFERDALLHRSLTQRVSDAITRWIGTLGFVLLHVLLFVGWVLANSGLIPGVKPFDPFPYGILTLFVSAEGVLLAIFVLVSQNRMSADATRRMHLTLQLALLTEQTSSKVLALLRQIAEHENLEPDQQDDQLEALASTTDVGELMSELERNLPRE